MVSRVFAGLLILIAVFVVGCGGSVTVENPDTGFDQLQQQIDRLEAPAGVDTLLWSELRSELSTALRLQSAQRAVAAAPATDRSKVTDLRAGSPAGGAVAFTWSYRNQGDYDLNGEVNVSDITPIAVYFQADNASPNWDEAQFADGDENLEINMSDITPIAVNFAAAVSGYYLQSTSAPADDLSWQQVADVGFGAGVTPPGGGPLEFSASIPEPVQGTVFRVAPYYIDGAAIDVGIGGNHRTYGTSPAVSLLLDEAQQALLLGDGVTARAKYDEASGLAADNPTANFGLAFLEIMAEANDIVLFLDEQNEPVFKNIALTPVMSLCRPLTHGRLWNSLVRVSKDREVSDIRLNDLTYQEIRTELIEVIAVLTDITDNLDIALESMPDDWSLTIPEDWNDPAAGEITFIKPDVLTLSASLDIAVGLLHFSIAYSGGALGIAEVEDEWGYYRYEITGLTGEWVDYEDLNLDNLIDMGEIFSSFPIPGDTGILNLDGQMRLNSTSDYIHKALTKGLQAVELYLGLGTLEDHWAFYSEQSEFDAFSAEWESYGRDYAQRLVELWQGPTLLDVSPEILGYNPEIADNPGADFSIRVNFAAFFTNMPEDLRDLPIRFAYEEGFDGKELSLPQAVADAFTDPTLMGLFPDGLTQEQFEILFPTDNQ